MRADVAAAILLAGCASYACRLGGYLLMRYVAITPRTKAWLEAIPLAVVGAILGPIAFRGGPPEWAGLAVAAVAMRVTGSELASIAAGIAVVAIGRAI
jgi:uncharacterized membrane protein